MARRKSRRSAVRGKPNYLWISTCGDLAQVANATVWDPLLVPGDWSGTVTETQCTLLRMVVTVYTATLNEAGAHHAENAAILLGSASEGAGGSDPLDISNILDWPDFFISYDRVLRIFRLEWDGSLIPDNSVHPVQFSQLPDPIMNLKTPRVLKGDDSVRLCIGGGYNPAAAELPVIRWFCRSLVRTGLR